MKKPISMNAAKYSKQNAARQREPDPLDQLLKESLAPSKDLPPGLLASLTTELKESHTSMQHKQKLLKNSWQKVAVIALVAVITLSTAVYAVSQLLSPDQVVDQFNYESQYDELLKIFTQDGDHIINQSQDEGDYRYTLLGIAAGKDLVKAPFLSNGEAKTDRSYLVGAVSRVDGASLKDDPAFDLENSQIDLPFRVAPLINGFTGSELNPANLNVGFSYTLGEDGNYYFLMESQNLQIFADRGVQLAIFDGKSIIAGPDLYELDAKTGKHEPKADFKGLNLIFDLDLDPSLADPGKAAALIQEQKAKGFILDQEDLSRLQSEAEVKSKEREASLAQFSELYNSDNLALLQEQWQEALTLFEENPGKIIRFSNENIKDENFSAELPEHDIMEPAALREQGKLQENSQYLIGTITLPKYDSRFGLYVSLDSEQADELYTTNGEIYLDTSDLLLKILKSEDQGEINSNYYYWFLPWLQLDDRFAAWEQLKTGDEIVLENRLTGQNSTFQVKSAQQESPTIPFGLDAKEIAFQQYTVYKPGWRNEDRLLIIAK